MAKRFTLGDDVMHSTIPKRYWEAEYDCGCVVWKDDGRPASDCPYCGASIVRLDDGEY